MDTNFDIVSPGAAAMIESLRAYGYTLNTAISDLVDNSISANANNIWIHVHWAGEASWISLFDDGHGMSEKALISAMRPGSQNPLDTRDEQDLGRFGLGLKTASFSQCRSLTVASRCMGDEIHFRRWDLDYVGKFDQWRLLKTPREGNKSKFETLSNQDFGTIVLLEKLDRICEDQNKDDEVSRRKFMDKISSLEKHLSMVFHRFIEGKEGLNIYINGSGEDHKVKPWDPFLSNHQATQKRPLESKKFRDGTILVQGFILPHKDKLRGNDHQLASGPKGWNAHQGFYVYRNKRLLVAGSWLGLGGRRNGWTKEEHYKLARIRVDIPNAVDSSWHLDVKKSSASPPIIASLWLEGYAETVRKEARAAFSHRGRYGNRIESEEVARLWVSGMRGGSQVYRIDRRHLLVSKLLGRMGNVKPELETLFRLLEETVPVQQIWLDIAEHSERSNEPMGGLTENEVMKLVDITIKTLCGAGRKPSKTSIDFICNMEAFSNFVDTIRAKYQGDD
ncbi:ATP-binding protein [Emcibacteraceae bacterium]|nr:ATP-binding protein [Emcibacteraceae bacterium]